LFLGTFYFLPGGVTSRTVASQLLQLASLHHITQNLATWRSLPMRWLRTLQSCPLPHCRRAVTQEVAGKLATGAAQQSNMRFMPLSPKLVLLLSIPPLMWAGNAVVGRIAIDSIGPLWLNVLRWLLALAILLPMGRRALATAEARAEIIRRWRYLAVLGLMGVGIYNALQYMSLRTSTPVNVTLIASSLPVWTMIIGVVAYGVRPSRMQLGGAVLSLAGVATVLSRGDVTSLVRIHFVEGDLLMLLAIICWSIYSWMLARPPAHMTGAARPAWNWAEFLVVQCLFGVCWAIGAAALGEIVAPSVPMHWSWSFGLAILFIAIGPSIIAYRGWGLAVAEAGPAVAAVFNNLTPLFAAVISAAVMREWPQPYHGVAFTLIVAGILVSSQSMIKRAT
jgi:drug/metabolite transporter (DMT)-like permease